MFIFASHIRIFAPATLVNYVHSVATFVFSCTDSAGMQSHFLSCGLFVFTYVVVVLRMQSLSGYRNTSTSDATATCRLRPPWEVDRNGYVLCYFSFSILFYSLFFFSGYLFFTKINNKRGWTRPDRTKADGDRNAGQNRGVNRYISCYIFCSLLYLFLLLGRFLFYCLTGLSGAATQDGTEGQSSGKRR